MARSKGPWIVNGMTATGHRIDAMGEEKSGIDFLQHPVAVCIKREDAEYICAMERENANLKRLLRDAIARTKPETPDFVIDGEELLKETITPFPRTSQP